MWAWMPCTYELQKGQRQCASGTSDRLERTVAHLAPADCKKHGASSARIVQLGLELIDGRLKETWRGGGKYAETWSLELNHGLTSTVDQSTAQLSSDNNHNNT